MRIDPEAPDRLLLSHDGRTLAEYVFRPSEPQLESPRPYALLRSLAGVDVTAFRPDDHVWHKGLSLALPMVGAHNFWGGPTYLRDRGYVQLPNNGAQVHRAFEACAVDADGTAQVVELLDWVAEDGTLVLTERRALTARVIDGDAWALTWRSALRNVSGESLGFGSPTSKGRENAGYCGIFWRGPVAFSGGEILTPEGVAGDAARGEPGEWLAFVAPDRSAGVLMLDGAAPPWFARSEEYAGLNPAPFFFAETLLSPSETLVFSAAVVVGDDSVAELAPTVGSALAAELRAAALSETEALA
ncbi:MAG TPA: PmoA family protein [Arachnia sp.]|nr:PmoA family protein [Arachnia sp.]HMT86034.1 PmoA family protein [Arachnia sp.]